MRGEVWANVWHTNRIARIAPQTGRVVGWIDLSGLMSTYRLEAEAVLNGIAYDAATPAAVRHRQAVAAALRDPGRLEDAGQRSAFPVERQVRGPEVAASGGDRVPASG